MCISLLLGTFGNAAAAAVMRRRLGKRYFPAAFLTAANLMWFFSANATRLTSSAMARAGRAAPPERQRPAPTTCVLVGIAAAPAGRRGGSGLPRLLVLQRVPLAK